VAEQLCVAEPERHDRLIDVAVRGGEHMLPFVDTQPLKAPI
jgi:hypothetical protein